MVGGVAVTEPAVAAVFWVVLAAACSVPTPSASYACSTSDDCRDGRACELGFCVLSSTDGGPPIDAEPTTGCGWSARHFDACATSAGPALTLDVTSNRYRYDTTSGQLTDPGGATTSPPSALVDGRRVLAVASFRIDANVKLRIVGSVPLVIASTSTIQVDGVINVSSVADDPGAGANPAECADHAAALVPRNTGGAGGGGGGGLGAAGGAGGGGEDAAGGSGGSAIAAPLLRGGCAGANGGEADAPGGIGGAGGGAIQLTARDALTIGDTGRINAGGAGGTGAPTVPPSNQFDRDNGEGGGGGGGSGGMIGLEAKDVRISPGAILAANGGAGGGGADDGIPGESGSPGPLALAVAAGGAGGGVAGDGGSGGATEPGAGAPGGTGDPRGGGGGGGGVGFIVLSGTTLATSTATFSPPPTMIPKL